MALILLGKSECPLCSAVIREGQRIVATTAFLSSAHPLWRFNDAAMHYECFQAWPHRLSFVWAYNESEKGTQRGGSGSRHHMWDDGTIDIIGPSDLLPPKTGATP